MENKNNKRSTLELISCIYEKSKYNGFDESLFKSIQPELDSLSSYFKTSTEQTLFLSIIFALNFNDNTVNLKSLTDHFSCNPLNILKYHTDLESLCNKNIIKKKKSLYGSDVVFANDSFIIEEKVIKAIIQNKTIPSLKTNSFESIIELLGKIYELAKERDYGEISTEQLLFDVEKFISYNKQFPLINYVRNLELDEIDSFILLYTIFKSIYSSEKILLTHIIEKLFDEPSRRIRYFQNVLSYNNSLVQGKIIEVKESSFLNDLEIKLSDSTLRSLNLLGLKIVTNKTKKENVIIPSKIQHKELYFNNEETKQLSLMEKLMSDEKFKEVQTRLSNKKLPVGVTCLLSGPPGVGKTEFAMQIARKTGREILKVDISQSKSMWFGESEKLIKQIFIDYYNLCDSTDKTPILFFNEADGIISKRQDIIHSNIGNTENTIQNIILEELEKFKGIFLATTNLINNFDTAFERRFLFKVKLNQPDLITKQKIWKLKLPNLTDKDYLYLSVNFDFSGGEIDNVARKCAIQEIIYGKEIGFEITLEFCKSEKLIKNSSKKIGFNQTILGN